MALVTSSESVNAVTRLIYLPIAVVGALSETGIFGSTVQNIVAWSPFGTTKALILWSLAPYTYSTETLWALLATLGYIVVFMAIGIRRFKWSVE